MKDNFRKNGFIQLKFGPKWRYVACARSFIQNFFAISIENKEKADKIALAASELLENAVKYASTDTTIIGISINPDKSKISIEVENESTPENIKELKRLYGLLKTDKPLEVYLNAMRQAALREDGKSQLGLPRIQYESGGELHLSIQGNRIRMTIEIATSDAQNNS